MKDLKLIVFKPVSQVDILVKVYAENIEHYKHLKVKLTREQGSSVVVHNIKVDPAIKFSKSVNNGILIHMPSIPVDNNTYALQLDASLVQNSRSQHQVHHFIANKSFVYVELDFNVKNTISEQPIKQTSIWSLVFIFLVLFILYNIEFVAHVLRDKLNFNINSITNIIPVPNLNQKNVSDYYDDAQIDQIVQSINNAKKKPKVKKA